MLSHREALQRIEHLEFCLKELTEPPSDFSGCTLKGAPRRKAIRRVFGVLLAAKGRRVSKEQILVALYWDRPDGDGGDIKIVDVYVCHLRRYLREQESPIVIETVWGQGYRAVVPEVAETC